MCRLDWCIGMAVHYNGVPRRLKGCFRCTCTKNTDGLCSTMVHVAVYSKDGRFIYAIWRWRTGCMRDIELSHVFFLQSHVVKILKIFYELNLHDMDPLQRTLGLHQPFCRPKVPVLEHDPRSGSLHAVLT